MKRSINKTDITVETYDSIVDEYVAYFKNKGFKGKVQFQKEIDYICSNLLIMQKIFDVGCAIGDYPKYLTESVRIIFDVIGIDSSKNMIEEAKKKCT